MLCCWDSPLLMSLPITSISSFFFLIVLHHSIYLFIFICYYYCYSWPSTSLFTFQSLLFSTEERTSSFVLLIMSDFSLDDHHHDNMMHDDNQEQVSHNSDGNNATKSTHMNLQQPQHQHGKMTVNNDQHQRKRVNTRSRSASNKSINGGEMEFYSPHTFTVVVEIAHNKNSELLKENDRPLCRSLLQRNLWQNLQQAFMETEDKVTLVNSHVLLCTE
eukprot:m.239583 g.239583  ORF g.239583 m.239583 type:complete len:217 (+) comp13940_c0_seq1:146-796(+)